LLANSICKGEVWHKRYAPKEHQFKYKLNMWLIDIDKPEFFNTNSLLVNIKTPALYKFKPNNYIRDHGDYHLTNKVKEQITLLGGELDGREKIFLLGQLSNLGLYFSPLNLYLVFLNDECTYVLAEVSNTPWNERHYYLLDKSQKELTTPKEFHVSPFFKLNLQYKWQFRFAHEKLQFRVDSYESDKIVFSASYNCNLIGFNNIGFTRSILKSPLNIYKIIFCIYFEALRLWLKRVPFVSYPKDK